MLIDAQTEFSNAQSVTATVASTNIIDLSQTGRNIGNGTANDLMLVLTVTTAFVGAAGTITPSLQTDDAIGFGSAVTVRTYDTIPTLSPIGTKRVYELDPYNDAGLFKRYIRLLYTVAGTLTASGISAQLVESAQIWKPYPVGFAVA